MPNLVFGFDSTVSRVIFEGLLSVKLCFTAGDPVITIQPTPSDTPDVVVTSLGVSSAGKVSSTGCCFALLGSSG